MSSPIDKLPIKVHTDVFTLSRSSAIVILNATAITLLVLAIIGPSSSITMHWLEIGGSIFAVVGGLSFLGGSIYKHHRIEQELKSNWESRLLIANGNTIRTEMHNLNHAETTTESEIAQLPNGSRAVLIKEGSKEGSAEFSIHLYGPELPLIPAWVLALIC